MRAITLHLAVGTDNDFQPTAMFIPKLTLGSGALENIPLSTLIPTRPWGGWPARIMESFLTMQDPCRSLIIPLIISPDESSITTWSLFFNRVKQQLIRVRSNLIAKGCPEIRTGFLIVRRDLYQTLTNDKNEITGVNLEDMISIGLSGLLCLGDDDTTPSNHPFILSYPSWNHENIESIDWGRNLADMIQPDHVSFAS